MALARSQHGLVTRRQLLERGLTTGAIHHRVKRGRLHQIRRGVYAVASPTLDRAGQWMAAVLTCGVDALLSHWSALALWGVDTRRESHIQVTVPDDKRTRRPGLIVHRRPSFSDGDRSERDGIPVTTVLRALFEVAPALPEPRLEKLLSESDRLGLVGPGDLRQAVINRKGQRGAKAMRHFLDRASYSRTDSELERRFLAIVRLTDLPIPDTQAEVGGLRVDFLWRELGMVVETDGLRYHRTEVQQRADRRRDRLLAARGLTVIRFTHFEVFRQAVGVGDELERVARACRQRRAA